MKRVLGIQIKLLILDIETQLRFLNESNAILIKFRGIFVSECGMVEK